MAVGVLSLAVLAGVCCSISAGSDVTKPTAALLQWNAYEMGAMISWNIDTMDGIQGCGTDMMAMPDESLFDQAVNVDFESWAQVMQTAGIKYCVLTVKHGCGFTLWPSKVTNITGLPEYTYTIQSNKNFAKRDLVEEYVTAMRKYGIKPGFYYSLGSNVFLGIYNHVPRPNGTKPLPGQKLITLDQYYEVVYQQQVELLTRYSDVTEMWYDGGVPEQIMARLAAVYHKEAADTVVFQGFGLTPNAVRWAGTESGHPTQAMWSTAGHFGTPLVNGSNWYPAECDTTVQNGDNWFFNKAAGSRTLSELKSVYHDTVGNNCNLMLNLAPDPTGTVHYAMTYAALGDFVSICYPADVTRYPTFVQNPVAASGGRQFSLTFGRALTVDRVVLQEDLRAGECILAYKLEVQAHNGAGNADSVLTLNGTWIGHKRIVLFPLPVQGASAVHLTVTEQRDNCPSKVTLMAANNCLFG